jgi:hypothetical protein
VADSPWALVSVTATSCLVANAASTAAIVMGEAAVPWLAHMGLPARLVGADGAVTYVGGWPADQPALPGYGVIGQGKGPDLCRGVGGGQADPYGRGALTSG